MKLCINAAFSIEYKCPNVASAHGKQENFMWKFKLIHQSEISICGHFSIWQLLNGHRGVFEIALLLCPDTWVFAAEMAHSKVEFYSRQQYIHQ